MGAIGRRAHGLRRAFLNPGRRTASTLGDTATLARAGGFFPRPEASGTGAGDAGEIPGDVRLARETSRGPHHRPAPALGLESGQRVRPLDTPAISAPPGE